MAAGEPERTDPADRAIVLLQRVRDLLVECRGVAVQLEATSGPESQAAAGERIAYGVLVAALEEGLVKALEHAVDVVRRFSTPAGTLGNEWLTAQEKHLEAGEQDGAPDAGGR